MWTIYKREMNSYFRSPVAYCIMGFFMVLVGLFFWLVNLNGGSMYFSDTLSTMGLFLIFFAPLITMKLLSDEKRNGTEVLLRTAPVSMKKIVVGKYFAALTLYLIMVGLTLIYPLLITFLMEGGATTGKNFGGYVAFILLGACYLSVSLFVSSFTESQVVAAVSGIVVLLLFYFMNTIGSTIGGTWGTVLQWLSPLKRYSDFKLGGFSLPSLFFYVSFSTVGVFLTVMNVERKRWN
jgi:ABC-2 type transport system permease protein